MLIYPQVNIPDEIVRKNAVHYDIAGKTERDLTKEMNTKGPFSVRGPFSKDGPRYWGLTTPSVFWTYDTKQIDSGGCALIRPNVVVTITIILPHLTTSSQASGYFLGKWMKLLNALRNHEEGHAQIAIKEGADLVQLMRTHSSDDTCKDLDNYLQTHGKAILERYENADDDYDKRTNHGADRGVHW